MAILPIWGLITCTVDPLDLHHHLQERCLFTMEDLEHI
jgi:hypothetical protein